MPQASSTSKKTIRVSTSTQMSLATLYHYMYCMVLCSALALWPVIGGALFLSARVAGLLMQFVFGSSRPYLSRALRVTGIVLLVVMLLAGFVLLLLYPVAMSSGNLWIVIALVLLITTRGTLMRRLVGRVMRRAISWRAALGLGLLAEALPLGLSALLLFPTIETTQAWQTFGGFALGSLLEGYGLWRDRAQFVRIPGRPTPQAQEAMGQAAQGLRGLGAYNAFEKLHTLVLMALQLTLVMMYTFIGLTVDELFTCLLIAIGLSLVLPWLVEALLRSSESRKPAATHLLLFGLFLWICGLALFYQQLGKVPHLMRQYLALGLAVGGSTISTTCLAELEKQMTSVARYGLDGHLAGYAQVRTARGEVATLVGQLAALILLTVLSFASQSPPGPESIDVFAARFRPLMIVPPLLLLASAFMSVLRFPLNNRHFAKLRRLLTLKDEGAENPALEKQLESVVVERHKGRFGVRLIITLFRPLYYHKVLGKENIAAYEDGRMILICNHGEIYGPIVANLYIPISFRPWVLDHMMDRDSIIQHMYQGTMMRQKWIPEKWKKPIIRMICPLLQWVFESIDAIPVYRGNPKALMKTFRLTIEAMQAGDNILLFPEDGEDRAEGEKGFAQEGVGKLYTGFAMLAPAYYAKTGKRAVFVPIYASKRLRTLNIGPGIEYNPEAPANDEKLRLVDSLLASMQAMYALELEKAAEKSPAEQG